MKIQGPPSFRMIDQLDEQLPDAVRPGDAFGITSGREAWHFLLRLNPFVEPANEITVRRARAQDLTTSGLGLELMISHEGELYNALVHIPPADHAVWQTGKLPVVIDCHGLGDEPRKYQERADIPETMVNEGALTIYVGASRGYTEMPLWQSKRSHDGSKLLTLAQRDKKETEMVETLLQSVAGPVQKIADAAGIDTEVSVDRDNTIAVGLSNGASFASYLAAAGVVNGAISFGGPTSPDIRNLKSDKPTSMLFVEGLEDKVVPPDGSGLQDYLTAEEAIRVFERENPGTVHNDTPEFLKRWEQPGVEIRTSTSGRHTVGFMRITEHGHAIPGARPLVFNTKISDKLGFKSSRDVQGAELVAGFLNHLRTS